MQSALKTRGPPGNRQVAHSARRSLLLRPAQSQANWYATRPERLPRSSHPSAVPVQLFKTSDGWIFVIQAEEPDQLNELLSPERVADRATRDVLTRYAQESSLGNFGVYVGNQEKGRVHAQATRG